MSIAILLRERKEKERGRERARQERAGITLDRIKIRHAAADTLLAAGRAAVEVDGKAKENRAIIARLGKKAAFSRKNIALDDEEERTTRPAQARLWRGLHISGFFCVSSSFSFFDRACSHDRRSTGGGRSREKSRFSRLRGARFPTNGARFELAWRFATKNGPAMKSAAGRGSAALRDRIQCAPSALDVRWTATPDEPPARTRTTRSPFTAKSTG